VGLKKGMVTFWIGGNSTGILENFSVIMGRAQPVTPVDNRCVPCEPAAAPHPKYVGRKLR
jgi:hypothetical protein